METSQVQVHDRRQLELEKLDVTCGAVGVWALSIGWNEYRVVVSGRKV